MSAIRQTLAFAAAVAVAPVAEAQLEISSSDPPFKAVLPGIPSMAMMPHPLREGRPHLRLLGTSGPYTVSVLVPTADAGMGALECASSTIRELPRRPGVPEPDSIYRAKLDDQTYIAIYAARPPAPMLLHAHVISAAAGSHCVEIHASKVVSSREDIESWFKGFGSTRIAPGR